MPKESHAKEPDPEPREAPGTAPESAGTARAVRLALPVPLAQTFDYALPEGMAAPLRGARVRVPFGRQQLIGLCVDPAPSDPHRQLRPLNRVLDSAPLLDEAQLALGQWLSDYYHHPLGEVLKLLLPPAARRGASYEPEQVMTYRLLDDRADLGRARRQRELKERLRSGPVPRSTLIEEGFSAAVIRALLDKGVITGKRAAPARALPQSLEVAFEPREEQRAAITAINDAAGTFSPFLLEGITGSGKTEVYLQCIAHTLKRGEQVLVLVPEIALTPQTRQRFEARFGQAPAIHSQISDRERLKLWHGCREGTIPILIGTRSASLTPFRRLGLIIVDEEHDSSYKQAEGLRYSARDLAVKRAADGGLPLVLGSATPSLETLANTRSGRYRHLELKERAAGAQEPTLKLIDVRGHRLEDGIGTDLRRAIAAHLNRGRQVLVFLNRRGYAPSLICGSCSAVERCPDCDQPFTFHRQPGAGDEHAVIGQLRCHHCGRQEPARSRCRSCDHPSLIPVGVGTQRSEAALKRWFPEVPCYRIDRDTARSKQRLSEQLQAIAEGKPALLIGTQILAKGHHFPAVTLVAMLGADGGFAAADFRAPERTAQLIVQVAGRAGRAEHPGEVWIQTLQPDNPLLTSLLREGYRGFAEQELERRAAAGLPPSGVMALLRADSLKPDLPLEFLTTLRDQLRRAFSQAGANGGVELLGPVPAPMARLAGRHRFQLLLLATERAPLHRALRWLRRAAEAASNASKLRWSIDVDPYDSR